MTYLLTQIMLCLLLTSILGLVVGWLLRGVRCRADINLLKKEVQVRGDEIKRSEQRIVVIKRSLKELENACKQEQQLAQKRIQQLEPYQAQAVWLRQELDDMTSLKDKQTTHLNTQLESLHSLQHEIKVNETIIQRLESQLRTQAAAKNRQVKELMSRIGEIQPLAEQLNAKDHELRKTAAINKKRINELTQQLHQLQTQTNPGKQASTPMPANPVRSQAIPGIETPIAKPDAPNNQNRTAHATATPQSALSTSPEQDDLKKIHGIGPVMERMLNDLGVTSFKQIMEFTRDDLEHVTAAIKVFPGRIERDDWIGGAKKEYLKKYANEI